MANLGFGDTSFATAAKTLQDMISAGNESGAKDYYNQSQQQYGFTDAQFAPATANMGVAGTSGFSADQVNSWKGNPKTQVDLQNEPAPAMAAYAPAQNAALKPYEKSPYLDQMAGDITSQMNDNWSRNQLPSIRSGAMAAGGFGGSRQGVVEANGLNDMNRSLGQNLTSLYGGDYTNSMNRNLQQYGMDQNFNLGQNQQNLTNQSQMQNFYLGNRQLDQSGMQLGANLYNMGNSGNVAAGQGQTSLSQQYLNAPLNSMQNYSSTISPYSGLNSTQALSSTQGGGASGMLGGALAGAQIGQNLGFGFGSSNAAGGSSGAGWGSGAAYGNQDLGQYF